jgi:uncharacterized protein YjbI with pentapeptide repeats
MANDDHIAQLMKGVAAWNQWRAENPSFYPDLNPNLTGAKLTYADLSEANLSGADLRRADLRGAKLLRADLRGADLHWADLSVDISDHLRGS